MRRWTFEHIAMIALVIIAVSSVAKPISDNSMLTHLRTGMTIVESGVPSHDPYSFSAHNTPWVVQSWLPALSYGLLERLAGWHAVIFEASLIVGLLAIVIIALARAGTMVRTTVAVGLPIALSYTYWASQRPLIFGLLFFALTIFIVDRKRSPWLLLPLGWLWVNSHGSWPLGFAWLTFVLIGAYVDTRAVDKSLLRYLSVGLIGYLLGAIGPLGLSALSFWTTVLGERAETFKAITEWQSSKFSDADGVVVAALFLISLGIVVNQRVPWRHLLPVFMFAIAALYSARNMPAFAVVIAPALGLALAPDASDTNEFNLAKPMVGLMAVAVLILGVRVVVSEPFNVKNYPIDAIEWAEQNNMLGSHHRLMARERVGNYLEFKYGETQPVFIDDRFDMYPSQVSNDYLHLVRLDDDAGPILNSYEIDTVLWENRLPLTPYLSASNDWQNVWHDDHWTFFIRK